MKTVLVTGVGGPAGKNVSELLIQRGFRLVGVDMQPVEMASLVYYPVPAALDRYYLDQMIEIARKEKPVMIIPTVTEELPVMADKWRWGEQFPVLLSHYSGIAVANDKYLTSQALAAKGVSVPRFALPSQISSAKELADRIGWPCISKPRVGRGGRGVAIREEKDFYLVRDLSNDYILQEFANGTDYAPNVYIGNDGMHLSVVLEKTELKQGLIGNARSVRRVDDADVSNLALEAALALGLRGPVDVDIRRRQDGQPVVLEVNARFGANIRYAPEVLDRMTADHLSA